jgi:hypothetical protein
MRHGCVFRPTWQNRQALARLSVEVVFFQRFAVRARISLDILEQLTSGSAGESALRL